MAPETSPELPEHIAPEDYLDQWKEIAAYLKRDVRTVQRWEKTEGLPVHGHHHEKQRRVYASKAEIDRWARGRRLPDAETDPGLVTTEVPSAVEAGVGTVEETRPDPSPMRRRVWQRWWLAALALPVLVAGILFWPRPAHEAVVLAVLPFKNLGSVTTRAHRQWVSLRGDGDS